MFTFCFLRLTTHRKFARPIKRQDQEQKREYSSRFMGDLNIGFIKVGFKVIVKYAQENKKMEIPPENQNI